MLLTVNGQPFDAPEGTDLPGLLTSLGLPVGTVVVEHNGVALLRSELPGIVLREGDRVELVRAVAGG